MRIDVLTTFPEMFALQSPGVLGVSIPARAIRAGLIEVVPSNFREFAANKHQKTDDRPFGGGPGMVIMCQPLWDAVQGVEGVDSVSPVRPCTRVLLTPQGTPLTQQIVEDLASKPRLLLIAGHYEGFDERVVEALDPLELSLGDFVLSGGELAALVLIDAIARLIPGAVGDEQSPQQDSFSLTDVPGTMLGGRRGPSRLRLLDCPQYTKPREWMGKGVPPVLLSGDHERIARWRLEERLRRTFARRPDLFDAQ